MKIGDAADKVLSLLEQTDEEEYTKALAVTHVNQAVTELADENDFNLYRRVSTITLSVPTEVTQVSPTGPSILGYPDYWDEVPGRRPVSEVMGVTDDEFSYIKRAWINIDGANKKFKQKSFGQLMDKHGDDQGTPLEFAIEGDYFYWRPHHANDDDTYQTRILWQSNPVDAGVDGTAKLLTKAPYAVIYRACQIASLWLVEDNRVMVFAKLAQDALDRWNIKDSMHGDEPSEMEDYNGQT
ncbi:MAG: hypothetical protein KAJ06_09265 [Gammaproteobacteria bacterium]|nr:hypothetical protein [Gammaproteobacteria bacterium]